ncbi:protein of unknown function [Paraburkholderia dioscoreae]|uniref:Uncharacterized protein n=1 Tax=Paraburkholderia dioscoreae TaxID=2604047 RepID=A0A5Q4ZLR4_9BURK|nr:protein of unknown function [Paraburkholderia dioscoreae]
MLTPRGLAFASALMGSSAFYAKYALTCSAAEYYARILLSDDYRILEHI